MPAPCTSGRRIAALRQSTLQEQQHRRAVPLRTRVLRPMADDACVDRGGDARRAFAGRIIAEVWP
eukprot:CAMPEP_0177255988 /NCGR_PEP_ID=MMETSP0367-20130122/56684_1 /TAXON_ID=447022 ORGANISM="Scrippsiella hangoei-like, Strain SHHI-4" /NCGR_SAMPLE_ID=MMETSP0367 /ASSEMBLY_ACC=CAM_ASM_000362 /LENGTH=64 /DNA_ID=CAMNT_0018709807 /DNA_START=17 /DNA_END=211 /DNA_ORIENTATION=-